MIVLLSKLSEEKTMKKIIAIAALMAATLTLTTMDMVIKMITVSLHLTVTTFGTHVGTPLSLVTW